MKSQAIVDSLHELDKLLIALKERHSEKMSVYNFKIKQIIKDRNSLLKDFEEIQLLNVAKTQSYPLSLRIAADNESEMPPFDVVQKKINNLFLSLKKVGGDLGNIYLTDFSFGSTILCFDLIKDKSKDIDSISDFYTLTKAGVERKFDSSIIERLHIDQNLDSSKYFSTVIKVTPSLRSKISMIDIGTSLLVGQEKISMTTETRHVLSDYIVIADEKFPKTITGFIREIDDFHKSFQVYSSLDEDSEFIAKVYFEKVDKNYIRFFSNKSSVVIAVDKKNNKLFFENFLKK